MTGIAHRFLCLSVGAYGCPRGDWYQKWSWGKKYDVRTLWSEAEKAKASRSGIAFIGLLKRNAVFIKENEAAVQEIFARVFLKDMVDGRTQPEEVVALDPSTGEVSQLSIDDLADKLD